MRKARRIRPVRLLGAAGSLLLGVSLATPAAAQEDSRWLAWAGCWEPTAADAGAAAAEQTRAYVVCVTPAEGGARFTTIADGETVAERLIVADGTQRPIDQSGCRGWETAQWSGDDQRVYLRSELTCDGGTTRTTSGVLAVHTPEQWIDVQGVSAGENVDVRVRRYRIASPERISAAGARAYEDDRSLALSTARTAAAQELTLSDVTEAASQVDAPVLEALLVERESSIRLDGDALLALDDAGVATSTIDLMVAQANPDKFMIDRASGEAVEVPAQPRDDDYRRRGRYTYLDYDPFWYGYPGFYGRYNRYGYGYGYGYGWGDPYAYWYGRGPQIIIIDPDGGDDDSRTTSGRMVKGRGFVPSSGSSGSGSRSSVNPTTRSSGSVTKPPPTSSGSKSSTGSSSTGRKAKRRGGG